MIPDVTKVNENWIYQSNNLIEASYSLTTFEQKIIRLLASMIKKDDTEFTIYEFTAKQLSEILKIDPKNIYRELDKMTNNLMARFINIQKDDEKQKFKKRHLVEIADYENGILRLKIHNEMKDFYLNLSWYTKYQLKNILQFKSTYSFRFYELLKQYQAIKERTITIDDMRLKLDIKNTEYPKYANLKQKVITPAVKEINEKTDLQISYEEIKQSRKIIAIKFNIEAQEKGLSHKENMQANDEKEHRELIQAIKNIIQEDITHIDCIKILTATKNNLDLIKEKYQVVCNYAKRNTIDNITAAMLRAIKEDWKNTSAAQISSFNNFKQRDYDFADLKSKLTAWQNKGE